MFVAPASPSLIKFSAAVNKQKTTSYETVPDLFQFVPPPLMCVN